MASEMPIAEWERRYAKPAGEEISVDEWHSRYGEKGTQLTAKRSALEEPSPVAIAVGQLKGLGSTVYNLGALTSKIPGVTKITEALGADPSYARFEGPKPDILEPKGAAQKTGYMTAKVAEFALPAGNVGKGAQIIKAAVGTGRNAKAAALAGSAALEGVAAGGTALAQGEGDPAIAAVVGAGVPVAWAASGPVRKILSDYVPARLVNSLIKPIDNYFTFGKNPGDAVAREGIVGRSLGDLLNKISASKKQIGRSLDAVLSSAAANTKKIDPVGIIARETAIAKRGAKNVTGNQAIINRMDEIETALIDNIDQLSGGTGILTPRQTTALKREIGEQVRFSEDAVEGTANQVLQRIYQGLDHAVDAAVPISKSLNERYANLLVAEKSAGRRLLALQRQDILGSKDWWAALLNIPAAVANRVFGSTAMKTGGAAALKGTANMKAPTSVVPAGLAAQATQKKRQ